MKYVPLEIHVGSYGRNGTFEVKNRNTGLFIESSIKYGKKSHQLLTKYVEICIIVP